MDHRVARANRIAGHLRQLVNLDEPLLGQARLHGLLGTLGVAHAVHVGELAGHDATLLLQRQTDLLARLVALHPVELRAGVRDVAGLVHDHRHRQVVALAQREVVRVVRRGDLHGTSAELRVDVVVGHHNHLAIWQERVRQGLAHQFRVALVLRVHGNGHVAQHRLHTGGRHDHMGLGIVQGAVADAHQLALVVGINDLDVGNSSLQHRGPVHHAIRPVDQAGVKKLLEHGLHRAGQAIVQSEALARPIHRITDGAHLALDHATVLVLPLPDLVHEGLAAIVEAILALGFLQVGLDLRLGGNTRVVRARQPQDLEALHALTASHRIHQGVVQCVAHVQLAGHVRRRQHNAKRWLIAGRVSLEVAGIHPPLVQVFLYRGGIPCRRKLCRAVSTNLVRAICLRTGVTHACPV